MKVLVKCDAVQFHGAMNDNINQFFRGAARIQNNLLRFYQDGIEHTATQGNWIIKINAKYIVITDKNLIANEN